QVSKGLRVGYVMGSGDEVPEALRQLGVAYDLLSANDIATADLSRYTTLLLGIRAYAARPELKVHNARLLEFVKNGGTLIVQYNTQEYDGNYGPFPYTMTARAEEISEEDSPVRILAPEHPVFQAPNKISARDFDGWVEQRGSKFWKTWAPEYTALLETNDAGQVPQRGGWLEARYGKGRYVYCAYAWYRQLPYAVPGAYRLFANLISLGAEGQTGRP
ncbi:MAG: PIG-L family deacetylase, partial [Acidobacteria bacterium]|nr:PIG-L family deacetylase [Acidobacteriota bacterium]